MKRTIKLLSSLFVSSLIMGSLLGCSGGKIIPYNVRTSSQDETTSSESETTSSEQQSSSGEQGPQNIAFEIDEVSYEEGEVVSVAAGKTVDIVCLVDDVKSNDVTWTTSDNDLATVTNGKVTFADTNKESSVTVTATSKVKTSLKLTASFKIVPSVINMKNSWPQTIASEDGHEFEVPKQQSALIFNQDASNRFYAEITFKVTDRGSSRDAQLSSIGLMTGTSAQGLSLNGTNDTFYYSVFMEDDSEVTNLTSSKYLAYSGSSADKRSWDIIKRKANSTNVYSKGNDTTLALLRYDSEIYMFYVKNGTRNFVGKTTYDGFGSTQGTYVWLGTSKGIDAVGNWTNDNGAIAYTAKDIIYKSGAEATAIYNEYKTTADPDASCTHPTGSLSHGFCMKCGKLTAPLAPYSNTTHHSKDYCNLSMSSACSFSVTYDVSWVANGGGDDYIHGWAMDIDSLGWSNGGWSFRGDWWGWGAWNPGGTDGPANPDSSAVTTNKFASPDAMKSVNATFTITYNKTGNYSGNLSVEGTYVSTRSGHEGETMYVHLQSSNFTITNNVKTLYLELGASFSTLTLNNLTINYGLLRGNTSDAFRPHNG